MWIDDWQQACCGFGFSVGEEHRWSVRLAPATELDGWPASVMTSGRFRLVDAGDGWAASVDPLHVGRRVAVGEGIQAEWRGDGRPGDLVEVHGLLLEDHHAEGFALTSGVVVGIEVVELEYRRNAHGSFQSSWEAMSLRSVTTAPRWFRSEEPQTADPDRLRREAGMLVELAPRTPASPLALRPPPRL